MFRFVRLIRYSRVSGRVVERYFYSVLHVPRVARLNGIRRAVSVGSFLVLHDYFALSSIGDGLRQVDFYLDARFDPVQVTVLICNAGLGYVIYFDDRSIGRRLDVLCYYVRRTVRFCFVRVDVQRFIPYQLRNVDLGVFNDGSNDEDNRQAKNCSMVVNEYVLRTFSVRCGLVFDGVNDNRFRGGLEVLDSGLLLGFATLYDGLVRVEDDIVRMCIFAFPRVVREERFNRLRFTFACLDEGLLQLDDGVCSRFYNFLFCGTIRVALYEAGQGLRVVL